VVGGGGWNFLRYALTYYWIHVKITAVRRAVDKWLNSERGNAMVEIVSICLNVASIVLTGISILVTLRNKKK